MNVTTSIYSINSHGTSFQFITSNYRLRPSDVSGHMKRFFFLQIFLRQQHCRLLHYYLFIMFRSNGNQLNASILIKHLLGALSVSLAFLGRINA